jgi:dihydrofolate reductase
MPTFTLLAVTSADGFIARAVDQHSFTWNSAEDKAHFLGMMATMDLAIIGRTSYALHAKEMRQYPCLCLTGSVTQPTHTHDTLTLINPAHTPLAAYVAQTGAQKIAVLGGAQVYGTCLNAGLVDEMYQTVEPLYFGSGISLFAGLEAPVPLALSSVRQLNARGTLLLHYQRQNR